MEWQNYWLTILQWGGISNGVFRIETNYDTGVEVARNLYIRLAGKITLISIIIQGICSDRTYWEGSDGAGSHYPERPIP